MAKLGELKVHECCICHTLLPYKPHRLVYQEYGRGRYKQYDIVSNFDFCDKCFKTFKIWIKKHRKENSNGLEKDV